MTNINIQEVYDDVESVRVSDISIQEDIGARSVLKMCRADCNKVSCAIISIFVLIPILTLIYVSSHTKDIYMMFVPFNNWFQDNPI